jgi:IS1 family transposase
VAFLTLKKTAIWIWKAYCRDTGELIDWECGGRDNATFEKLYERLKLWDVKIFFSDGWRAYSDLIPPELLVQSKSQTHLIESNNAPQRHWFGRFRRRTCIVSRSLLMVDLTVMLYAKFHVNNSWRDMVHRGCVSFQL